MSKPWEKLVTREVLAQISCELAVGEKIGQGGQREERAIEQGDTPPG